MFRFFALIGSLSIYLLPFAAAALICYYWFSVNILSPLNPQDKNIIAFEVQRGSDLTAVAKTLEQKNIIKNWWSIALLGELADSEPGKDPNIVPMGEYALSPSLSPGEILKKIKSGEIVYRDFTLAAGTTVKQMPDFLAATTLVTKEQADAALNNNSLIVTLKVPSTSFEGYLMPGTYQFSRPETAEDMIAKIVTQGREKLRTDHPKWTQRAVELGYSPHEILTIASLVQAEANTPDYFLTLASVIHNRLRISMPLQSDKALLYGMAPDSAVDDTARQTPTSFNTHISTGLPPTPICSPSVEALQAALNPEDTDALYYLTDQEGKMQFFATFREYQKARRGR